MLPHAWKKILRARTRRPYRRPPLGAELLEARTVPASLTLAIAAASVSEAAGANATTATVTRAGDTSTGLTVSLTSSDTTEATVPATVTIPAGQTSATFGIDTVDDAVVDGTQTVTVTGSATFNAGQAFGLDPSFAGSGLTARTSLLMYEQFPHAAMVRQADGKILAASEYNGLSWQVTRLNADGTVDTSFGTNGVAVTDLPRADVSNPVPHKIVVQADGKILVGGMYANNLAGGFDLGVLVRYNADGTPDTGFGAGGIATNLTSLTNDWVEDIAVRPDGRILLGLGEDGSVFSRVAQLNANGTFDTSFGTSGVASLNLGYWLNRLVLLSDGTFLAAGSFRTPAHVVRVQANGSGLVPTFGTNGVASLDFGTGGVTVTGLALDGRGRIVVGGDASDFVGGNSTPADFAAGRLNADGTVDTTFAGDGTATLDINGSGGNDVAVAMAIQSDDKVVLAGLSDLNNVRDSALARFNADGTPDTTLDGDGGFRQSLVNTYAADMIFAADLQPDGKLLALTGWGTDMRVARFDMGPMTLTAADTLDVLDNDVANHAPVAADQAVTTDEDTALTGGQVTATDADGDRLFYAVVSGPAHGTLVLGPDGSFTYTPAANYNGSDSFTFNATDGNLTSNTATVSITVNPVNDTPVAAGWQFGTDEDTPLNDFLRASDVDGDALTYSIVSQPAQGTVRITDPGTGAFTYTPPLNYNGTVSFAFKVNDGTVDSNVATVFVTVRPVNDAPVAQDKSASTAEDTPLSGTVTATDVDNTSLTYALVSGPAHGTLALNADGSFTYTPAANYNGSDSFTFKASDGQLGSNVATVSITVAAVNDAPVAQDLSVSTAEDTAKTGQLVATDVDSTSLTYALVAGPSHGTVLLNADGSFTYTPAADYNGADSFTFKASDGALGSNTATVSITVTPVNDAPVAKNQSVSTNEDTALTGAVAATDVDSPTLTYALVAGPSHGTVVMSESGSFTYTPAANYNGADSFTFKANDGSADSNVATVSITVTPVNDPPVAQAQSDTIAEDTDLPGILSAIDVDGDTLTYAVVTPPSHGILSLNADGSFTYTPAPNYNGSDSFTFTADDGQATSAPATVSITVTPVNDAPTLAPATFSLPENSPSGTVVGTVTGSDVEGDTLGYSIVGGNTGGAFAIDPTTGQITVANPAALDYEMTPTFTLTVQVKDPGGLSGTGTVTVNLTNVIEPVIDILPGNGTNTVNIKSHGKIEVALLWTPEFDPSRVDVSSLRFGATGTEDSLSRNPHQGPRARMVDVNGDGHLDLVVEFEIDKTGFQVGDTVGILTGNLDGVAFSATDVVSVKSPGR